MRFQVKMCESCGKPTEFIDCRSNPDAAEWYCSRCHRSYFVDDESLEIMQRARDVALAQKRG